MELKFFSPVKFSNLNWRINPSLEGCWDAEAPERILSGRVFAVEGRKGEGRGPSKCGWWRQRKQNIFYWSAKLPFLSLSPLGGTRTDWWHSRPDPDSELRTAKNVTALQTVLTNQSGLIGIKWTSDKRCLYLFWQSDNLDQGPPLLCFMSGLQTTSPSNPLPSSPPPPPPICSAR